MMRNKIILVMTVLLASPLLHAADGELDTSFNPDPSVDSHVVVMTAPQTDGKILASGELNSWASGFFSRLNADGSLDSSFNLGGTGIDGSIDTSFSATLQSDNKIIISGSFAGYNGVSRNGIARLNTDGSLDSSFDPGIGFYGVMYNGDVQVAAIQADNKIIIGGWFTTYNNVATNNLVRLNIDGSLDSSFNNNGVGTNSIVYDVVVQDDQKIIIGGDFTTYNGVVKNRIARLNPDGSLDSGFNASVEPGGYIKNIMILSDGKILIVGYFNQVNGMLRNKIARLNVDGSLDSSFDAGATDINIEAVAAQADNKIVFSSGIVSAVSRLNTDGSLDSSFNQGVASDSYGSSFHIISTMAVQPDGNIVIAGSFTHYNGIARNKIARVLSTHPPLDADLDGIFDSVDNCVMNANADQLNTDGDTQGNACDTDDDDDGVFDESFSAVKISAGGDHTCVVDSIGVSCWGGANNYGASTVPPLVNPVAVSTSAFNSCALHDTGVYCWGYNGFGVTAVPVLVNPVAVSVGDYHACALDDSGVHCWGTGSSAVPALLNPVQVSVGLNYACALDATDVHCWGVNDAGQTAVPVLVNPVMVSAGWYHACALDDVGVHCWGDNGAGRSTVPALVNPVVVSAGGAHTCALDANGVHCWGWHGGGVVPVLLNPFALSAGAYHTCALDLSGVHCWGDSYNSQNIVPVLHGIPEDAFPLDPTESVDTDNDTIGNNADWDDDGDGIPDGIDANPLSAAAVTEITLPLNGTHTGARISSSLLRQ